MLTDPPAPTCARCGAAKFTIPSQRANLGWLCGCCDATGSTCEHKPQAPAVPAVPATTINPDGAVGPSPAPPTATLDTIEATFDRTAKIPEGLPHNPFALRVWAQASGLSARYFGCPVYLVGGALTDPDPRDIDLVVAIPDDLFVHSYGEHPWQVGALHRELDAWETAKGDASPAPIWRRWARDCAKHSRLLTLSVGRAVDFKTQPLRAFEAYAFKPRVRLDCAFMPEPSEAPC